MFAKILIPVDGSEHANRAIEAGSDLALHYGASVTVLHVLEDVGSNLVPEGLEYLEQLEHVHITERDLLSGVAKEIVGRAANRCLELGVTEVREEIIGGNPREVIVRTAQDNGFDLVVMGRRGLGRMSDLLLGSVSHRVAQTADCACLTIK